MTAHDLTRRQALSAAGAMLAGSPIAPGPTAPAAGVQPVAERAGVAPRAELVNTQEYEEQARLKLAPAVYSLIAGGDREGFDRITIRPRVLVDTLGLESFPLLLCWDRPPTDFGRYLPISPGLL